MDLHEMDFLVKALEHGNENPETARTTIDAVVNTVFPEAKTGVPKNEKVERTLNYMLNYGTGRDMVKLAKILTGSSMPDFRCEQTRVTRTRQGYLFAVWHYDFPGPFFGGLGSAGYFANRRGIILHPDFGPKTKLLIETLDKLPVMSEHDRRELMFYRELHHQGHPLNLW